LLEAKVKRGGRKKVTVKELQKIAKGFGLKFAGLRKAELIRTIQRAEGNFDCFGKATEYCDQIDCLYLKDCLP
jgi:hypothetical protein